VFRLERAEKGRFRGPRGSKRGSSFPGTIPRPARTCLPCFPVRIPARDSSRTRVPGMPGCPGAGSSGSCDSPGG
jgi:hypothetical protein